MSRLELLWYIKKAVWESIPAAFSIGADKVIEFHEDEYLDSPVDDGILLLVLLICGQEVKDKLLYGANDHARTNRMDTAKLGGAT